jgi:LPXTG-motif cell wall-anchored protein
MRLRVLLTTTLLVLGAQVGTAHAQYPPSEGSGSVSRSTVESGGTVEFCGDGFEPDSEVIITDNGDEVRTVTANADGEFCTTLTLTGAGTHVLAGTGTAAGGGQRVVTATVTVVSAAGLPRTGSGNTIPGVMIGLSLVAGGLAALYAAQRRRGMALTV